MAARCEETSAVLGSGEPVTTKLHRIAEKARNEPEFKFTGLYHLDKRGAFTGMLSAVAERRGGRHRQNDQGYAHYCGTRRDGTGFRMKRVTARKKFVAKVKIFKEWLKRASLLKTGELWAIAKAELRGHYNYCGVTDNLRGIVRFLEAVKRLLFKWLNRRGKRNCINWEKFNKMLKRFPLPKPRIRVSMFMYRKNKDSMVIIPDYSEQFDTKF